jgi:adenylate kinase family enzyme
LHITIIGPPGSGKSTLALGLQGYYTGLEIISSGDIARSMPNVPLGLMAPEDDMRRIIRDKINKNQARGFILEGFPRTIAQYIALRQWNAVEPVAIHLYTDPVVSIERMLQRAREDDQADAMAMRLETYQQLTVPLVQILKDGYKLIEMDATDLDPSQVLEIAITHLQRYQ